MKAAAVAIASAAALALTGCALEPNKNNFPGERAVGSDGYTVTATFDSIDNLVPNSHVQYHDVTIGTVSKIGVKDWHAEVTLRLLKKVTLPANVTMTVGQKTLLGAEYVQINDPAQPQGALRAGQHLALEQTGNYPETEQVLSAVALLLNNGGLSQISTITSQLNDALGGHEDNSRALIGKLNELLKTLDAQKNNVIDALSAVNGLSAKLAAQSQAVGTAIDHLAPGLRALNDERHHLVTALASLGKFGSTANLVIDTSRRGLLDNLAQLRPVLTRLNQASSSIPDALKEALTVPFPVMTTQNAVRGDFANLFATIDLTSGTLSSAFLGGGGATSPALQASNPLTGPLAAPTATPREVPTSKSSGATVVATASPGAPTATSTTSTAPCGLVQGLLGGC